MVNIPLFIGFDHPRWCRISQPSTVCDANNCHTESALSGKDDPTTENNMETWYHNCCYIYIYPYNYRISSAYSTWDYTGNIYIYIIICILLCIYIYIYWLILAVLWSYIWMNYTDLTVTSLEWWSMYGESSPNGHMITAEIAANSEIIRPDTYGTISYMVLYRVWRMALCHLVPFY